MKQYFYIELNSEKKIILSIPITISDVVQFLEIIIFNEI